MNKTEILGYCEEFINSDPVTIEFSVHKHNLSKLFRKLKKFTPLNLVWTAHTCKACADYHGKGYVHVELHKVDCPYAGFKASNLLKITRKVNL